MLEEVVTERVAPEYDEHGGLRGGYPDMHEVYGEAAAWHGQAHNILRDRLRIWRLEDLLWKDWGTGL